MMLTGHISSSKESYISSSDSSNTDDEQYIPHGQYIIDEEYTPETPPRFVNNSAEMQFDRCTYRLILVERKFEVPSPTFEETICFYKWGALTRAPAASNVELAREYYTNANSTDPNLFQLYGVYMRGTFLKVTSHTINQHFQLQDYPEGEFDQLIEDGNVDYVIDSVGLPGASWVRNARSEAVFMKTNDLTAEARMWLLFINSRLMPTTHNVRATREWILLIYAIQHKMTIDVGKIIMQSIQRAQDCSSIPVYFPLLLSQMARRKRIQVDPTDDYRNSPGTIGKPQWQNYLDTEGEERLRRNA